MTDKPRILIAAPAPVFNKLQSVLADQASLLSAEDFDAAVERLATNAIDLFIVCYVFDEVRPYRILNYLQEQDAPKFKTVLVRALPVPLSESESEIEEAYRQLGVAQFVNLSDAERRHGRDALEGFRDRVLALATHST